MSSYSKSQQFYQMFILIIAIFYLLAQISSSSSSMEGANELADGENQQFRAKRHPKSRQNRVVDEECILGYKERIEHHCRYPSMEQPCFHQSTTDSTTTEAAVENVAKKCCQSGLLCSTNDFEGLCCRTMDCLQKCYGPTFFQRFRDRGFKYLDILLRSSAADEQKNEAESNLVEKVEKELVELEEALVRKIAKEVEEENPK